MIGKIFDISILNTIRMNYRYFGWGGVLHTYILCGKNLKIKELQGTVVIGRKERAIVRIGFGRVEVIDGRYNRSIWSNMGTIVFKGDAHFSQGSKIIVKPSGSVTFGNHFMMNGDTEIISRKAITFGDECLLSWGSLIMDNDFHKIFSMSNEDRDKQINPDEEIIIGNHCWIGARTIILKGTVLPENTIVSAGSIVRKRHIDTNTILIGDKEAKQWINWDH